jgi:nitroreductase
MAEDPGLFETMHSMRAMRRLKPDSVPEALLREVLDAAVRAPSGQNTQRWAFVVLRDEDTRRFFGDRYRHWIHTLMGERLPALDDHSPAARSMRAALHLADHMSDAPVIVLACGKRDWPFVVPTQERVGKAPPSYGSIYPAVENLLLACRGRGLGASLTTTHQMFEDELASYLGIPDTYGVVAAIPIGYPTGRFGPVRRKAVGEVTHFDRWGEQNPNW